MILGCDPGRSGCLALLSPSGAVEGMIRLASTEREVWDWLEERAGHVSLAVLEKVQGFRGQAAGASFKFGQSYGFCRGILIAARVRVEGVTPAVWQRALSIPKRGAKSKAQHKAVLRGRAQEMFPGVKITNAEADALLLAEYGRRRGL